MTPSRFAVCAAALCVLWCVAPVRADKIGRDGDALLAIADVPSPSVPPPAIPSPLKSPDLKSPSKAPLLPPEGLPTAPPPDKVKPVEPQAEPDVPKADPASSEEAEPDLAYRYLAVITGACDGLVVDDHTVPECAGKLLNVDFGNGRVAFLFSGREGATNFVMTFSGGVSAQPDKRVYQLTIDRMSTTTLDAEHLPVTVIASAEGACTMRGDPTHEQTRFECRVRHAGRATTASFRTSGKKPEVYAGPPIDQEPDEQASSTDRLADLAFPDRFPKAIQR